MTSKSFINDCQQQFESFKNDELFTRDNQTFMRNDILSPPLPYRSDENIPTPTNHLQNYLPSTMNGQSTFTVLEQVREIQKLKLSPLEGCTMTREEISMELPIECFQRTLDDTEAKSVQSSIRNDFAQFEQKPVLPVESLKTNQSEERTVLPSEIANSKNQSERRTELPSEIINSKNQSEHRTVLSSGDQSNEKCIEWKRDDMHMFNPESLQGRSSFTVLEQVREVQKLKLSPLEGCTMTREEISLELPIECFQRNLNDSGTKSVECRRDGYSQFEQKAVLPIDSFETNHSEERTVLSRERIDQSERRTVLSSERTDQSERRPVLSSEIVDQSERRTVLSSDGTVQSEHRPVLSNRKDSDVVEYRDWSRDETTAFIPEISQNASNSFNTIEEIRDVQHIKLSPLEGCSHHGQVTTVELSPQDYLLSLTSMTS